MTSQTSATKLFIYGTLAPGCPNEHILADLPGTWEPASITGTLYENGWGAALGYPGIVLSNDGDPVAGLVFSSDALARNWQMLDDFEGEGYQRVITTARLDSGEAAQCFVYALNK